MQLRPQVAVLVAECITQYVNLETMLGLSLALIIEADQAATISMYGALENRSAQVRMLLAGAESKLERHHFAVLEAIILKFVRPAMRERDRLAHWVWGYSPEITDGLLLMEPNDRTSLHAAAINPPSPIAWDFSKIFVIRETDLKRFSNDLKSRATSMRASSRRTGKSILLHCAPNGLKSYPTSL